MTVLAEEVLDSSQMERDLQSLPWSKFRRVIEAIPKMKADVEAYGPIGWTFVESNYQTYHWQKKIDRLKEDQRKQLADLIAQAKSGQPSAPVSVQPRN